MPTFGQRGCKFLESLIQDGNLLIELVHIHIIVVDAFQFPPNRNKPLEHGRNRPTVFLLKTINHIHSHLYLVQPCRICLNAIQIITHLVGSLLQGDIGLLDHRLCVCEPVIIACNFIERMCDTRKCGQDGSSLLPILTEKIIRLSSMLYKPLCVGETANLRLELPVLPLFQLRLRDLLFLPAQKIQALADPLDFLGAILAYARLFLPVRIDRRICVKMGA